MALTPLETLTSPKTEAVQRTAPPIVSATIQEMIWGEKGQGTIEKPLSEVKSGEILPEIAAIISLSEMSVLNHTVLQRIYGEWGEHLGSWQERLRNAEHTSNVERYLCSLSLLGLFADADSFSPDLPEINGARVSDLNKNVQLVFLDQYNFLTQIFDVYGVKIPTLSDKFSLSENIGQIYRFLENIGDAFYPLEKLDPAINKLVNQFDVPDTACFRLTLALGQWVQFIRRNDDMIWLGPASLPKVSIFSPDFMSSDPTEGVNIELKRTELDCFALRLNRDAFEEMPDADWVLTRYFHAAKIRELAFWSNKDSRKKPRVGNMLIAAESLGLPVSPQIFEYKFRSQEKDVNPDYAAQIQAYAHIMNVLFPHSAAYYDNDSGLIKDPENLLFFLPDQTISNLQKGHEQAFLKALSRLEWRVWAEIYAKREGLDPSFFIGLYPSAEEYRAKYNDENIKSLDEVLRQLNHLTESLKNSTNAEEKAIRVQISKIIPVFTQFFQKVHGRLPGIDDWTGQIENTPATFTPRDYNPENLTQEEMFENTHPPKPQWWHQS